METKRIKVMAKDLRPGQKLASGGTVTQAPYRSIATETGKVNLEVDGFFKSWNARTIIVVLEEETTNA